MTTQAVLYQAPQAISYQRTVRQVAIGLAAFVLLAWTVFPFVWILLTSLKNFVSNGRDRERTVKRGGGVAALPLEFDRAEGKLQREIQTDETPERIFDRLWARTLLDRAMARLIDDHAATAKHEQLERLMPYLTRDEPVLRYAETALQLEMSEGAVKVAVHRLRRRFKDLVYEEIAHTVSSPADIEDELRHLWSAVRG